MFELTDGQQPVPQHVSPELQYVFAQQVELEEIQNGAMDRSGGIQQISNLRTGRRQSILLRNC